MGRKAIPSISLPEASTSRSRSELAPLRVTAVRSRWRAATGVVSGGRRKIHGTLVEVSFLSLAQGKDRHKGLERQLLGQVGGVAIQGHNRQRMLVHQRVHQLR